jgi:hypothetical protein
MTDSQMARAIGLLAAVLWLVSWHKEYDVTLDIAEEFRAYVEEGKK